MLLNSSYIILLIGTITVFTSTILQNTDAVLQSQEHIECHPSLWKHVYNPARLASADPKVNKINSCVTVRGIIIHVKPHADGDNHIWVKLDPGYASKYLTHASQTVKSSFHGTPYSDLLIAEPVCQHKATQPFEAKIDCIPTKGTYLHHISIPPDGSHVCITGSWVTDDQHKGQYPKGWAEIHPVSNIGVITPSGKCQNYK